MALIRLASKTRGRADDDEKLELKIEVYSQDMLAWPIDTALRVLDEWPSRSEFWPTWKELEGLRAEMYRDYSLPALPKPAAPEHRPLRRENEGSRPFRSKAEWDAHQRCLQDLRDRNRAVFGGDALRMRLLKWGESIEARNRPHAVSMGWVR